MSSYIFSEEGYEELKRAITFARDNLEKTIKAKGEAHNGQDSWHDEGFKTAIVEEMGWSRRLGELQRLLSRAEIVKPEEQNTFVQFGTGVIIEYEDGTEKKFILDGYQIGNLKDRVSIYGPLGKALIGAKVGEERRFRVGNTERKVRVKKIILPSMASVTLGKN